MSEPSAESVEGSEAETDAGTRNAVFDVLTDEARCYAIEYLAMETGSVSLDDLVGFVTAASASGQGTPQTRERTEIRFHHIHLPKMDAAGLLDYDPDDRTVTPTEKLDAALPLID